MIKLNDIFPFAKGGNRMCFVHPDNPNRCLKVIHPGILTKIKKSKPWYKQLRSSESFDDNLREQNAYNQKALKSNNPEIWDHLAKWYGMVETDIGIASETELIRNNGRIAETLEEYLFRNGLTDEIKDAIEEFHKWLRQHLVLTKNLIPHNLVLTSQEKKLKIKIIDGLGSQHSFPYQIIQLFLQIDTIERRVELMWSRINWDLSGRQGDWK
jgi:hypothetical protein